MDYDSIRSMVLYYMLLLFIQFTWHDSTMSTLGIGIRMEMVMPINMDVVMDADEWRWQIVDNVLYVMNVI